MFKTFVTREIFETSIGIVSIIEINTSLFEQNDNTFIGKWSLGPFQIPATIG